MHCSTLLCEIIISIKKLFTKKKTINVRNTKRYSHHVQKELNELCKNGLICLKYAVSPILSLEAQEAQAGAILS